VMIVRSGGLESLCYERLLYESHGCLHFFAQHCSRADALNP
jgi:hypothetical protein